MAEIDQIRGMFQPVPTPFDDEGELDESLYGQLVEHYIDHGANALFVFGPFGQGPAMNLGQRMRGLEIALERSAGRIPVVPDIGAVDPYSARSLGEHARSLGAISVAISAPYYYADRSPDELIKHFKMIDDSVELPFIIVTDPPYQGYPISLELMARLRDAVPRLIGAHPAKTGIAEVLGYLRVLGSDFKIFPSPESLYPGMLLGQSGTMSPPIGMVIEVGAAFVAAIDVGDLDEALRLHLALLRYLQRLGAVRQWYRAGYREGLRYIGFPVRRSPRWPTAAVPAEVAQEIRDAIDEVRSALA